jgi:hypothetical protein
VIAHAPNKPATSRRFTDRIVAARACAAIERQIKRAERWLEASASAAAE